MLRANHFQVSSVLASASHSYILQEECDSLDGKRLADFIHFSSDSSQLRQTKIVWVFTMCLKSWMAPSAKKLRGKAVLVEQVNVTSSVWFHLITSAVERLIVTCWLTQAKRSIFSNSVNFSS